MKRTLPQSVLLLGATLALAALPFRGVATPYSAAVDTTTTPGSVSFRLNEDTDNVKILFDTGTSTNDLGALTRAGSPYTFSLGAATNYQIVVTKKSANGFTFGPGTGGAATALKISTDTTRILNVFYPRGMDVNKNPKSPYFGRIYLANDQAGTTTTFISRPTTAGIYAIGPDQSDVLGQGDNALSAGYPMTAALDSTPYRVKVGEDDNVYIADWSDNTGNLYQANPNLSSGVYALQAEDHVSCAVGGGGGLGDNDFPVGTCNNHGSIASCYVAGSTSAGNLTFYTIDEDMQDDHTSTVPTQMNSLWQYSVGSTPLPYAPNATRLWTSTGAAKDGINFVSVTMGFDRAPDGKFFITTLRSNGSESGLVVRSSDGATTLFNSYNTSRALNSPATVNDYLVSVSAVAVSRDDKWTAVATSSSTASGNTVWIVPLTNGIPDLSKRNKLTTGANVHNNEVAFDAAGNLYLVNNGAEALRIFSPGGTSIAVYSNDSSGLNASFAVQRIDPDIKTQPVSITKNAGTSAAFTVTATGSGTLKYQWTKNGANVSGATASSFTVSADAQQVNAGTYTVVVTNSVFGGSVTSAVVTLTVVDTGPLILTDLPATKTIIAGQTNTFTIPNSGTDPRGYQWYFNNNLLAGATTTTYTRANVQNPNDAGTYYVVLTNPVSPYVVTSTACALTITESIPVVTVNPVSQTNGAGANLNFSVASYGTDPRTYLWQRDGVDVASATGTAYTLTNAQIEDVSVTVKITNPQGGPITSAAAVLTITNKGPIIITQPVGITNNYLDTFTLSVVAQGENPLSYQWYQNGSPVGVSSSTYSVASAQGSDSGTYYVMITSGAGTFSTNGASVQVRVLDAPLILADLPNTFVVYPGRTTIIPVGVVGLAPLTYQWQMDSTNLASSARISGVQSNNLVISNIQSADLGTYQLLVHNSRGDSSSALTTLLLEARPTFNTDGSGWKLNSIGTAPTIGGDTLVITDSGASEARSAYFMIPMYIAGFTNSFTYTDVGGGGVADGAAFCIQNSAAGASALGGAGGQLGYGTITNSIAVEFNLYAANIRGMAIRTNGVTGTPYIPVAPVDFTSGDPINVTITYVNKNLQVTLLDTVTSATYTTNLTIDIPAVCKSSTAYIGLSGGTGGSVSYQTVSAFTFAPIPTLSAQVGAGNTVVLSWPGTVGGFGLLSTSDVSAPNWQPDPATVDLVNGQWQATVSAGSPKFYKLVLP